MDPKALFQAFPISVRDSLFTLDDQAAAAFPANGAATTCREISATILTKNNEARLDEVLTALRWCDEVVLFDTGSTDETVTIAERYSNVAVHRLEGPFPGFGPARHRAVSLASHDWILSIDSDEVVSAALAHEIAALDLEDPRQIFAVPFHNFFDGRLITSCGWFPDRHERLFNRTVTNFCESVVHERVQTKGFNVRRLHQPVLHYSYNSMDEFLQKMRTYVHLFAIQHVGRKSSGPGKAVLRSVWAFAKSYLMQRGFLQGRDGLVISAYNAQTVFWKYMVLHEANRRLG